MKVTFAQFNVEHDEKSYGVQMGIQYVTNNRTYTTVTIYGVNEQGVKRVLRSFSGSGRQMISPSNAKRFLRDTLIAEGVIKKREEKPKDYPPGEVATFEGKIYKAIEPPSLFDLKATPGAEINDQRKAAPGLIKKIKKFFS